jgi:hypothetical protein
MMRFNTVAAGRGLPHRAAIQDASRSWTMELTAFPISTQ